MTFLKLNLAYYIMNFDILKSQKNILLVYYFRWGKNRHISGKVDFDTVYHKLHVM